MSMFSSFLHPKRGYDAAQNQLDKYYQQAQGYNQKAQDFMQPYAQQGQDAYSGLNDAMKQLMDPQALQDKWISGYQESGAAKNTEQMAQEHGLNAAQSMGILGATPTLGAIQEGTTNIGLQDRQNYLNDMMQKYMSGAGLAGNMYNTGFNASNQMGQNASQMGNNALNMGQNSAQTAYNQNNANGNLFGSLLGGAAGLAGSALAGPGGGMLAKWMIGGK